MSAKTKTSHYMQSADWAHLRPESGWQVLRPRINSDNIYAYSKKTPVGNIVYVPGFEPNGAGDIRELAEQIQADKNIVCKVETCQPINPDLVGCFETAGWKKVKTTQYDHTVILDLTQSENDLWMGMKPRGRQEVNYARRDGVAVELVEPDQNNLEAMYDLLEETSERKSFGIRNRQNTLHLWSAFAGSGHLRLAFAKHNKQVIAGGVFITEGDQAWYVYGGSKPEFNKLFGPRLLVWETALALQKEGFKTFDLGGIPAPDHYETSKMKGIFIFKTAFSREIVEMMPAYELPLKKVVYPVWKKLEPVAIKAKRRISKLKG